MIYKLFATKLKKLSAAFLVIRNFALKNATKISNFYIILIFYVIKITIKCCLIFFVKDLVYLLVNYFNGSKISSEKKFFASILNSLVIHSIYKHLISV